MKSTKPQKIIVGIALATLSWSAVPASADSFGMSSSIINGGKGYSSNRWSTPVSSNTSSNGSIVNGYQRYGTPRNGYYYTRSNSNSQTSSLSSRNRTTASPSRSSLMSNRSTRSSYRPTSTSSWNSIPSYRPTSYSTGAPNYSSSSFRTMWENKRHSSSTARSRPSNTFSYSSFFPSTSSTRSSFSSFRPTSFSTGTSYTSTRPGILNSKANSLSAFSLFSKPPVYTPAIGRYYAAQGKPVPDFYIGKPEPEDDSLNDEEEAMLEEIFGKAEPETLEEMVDELYDEEEDDQPKTLNALVNSLYSDEEEDENTLSNFTSSSALLGPPAFDSDKAQATSAGTGGNFGAVSGR